MKFLTKIHKGQGRKIICLCDKDLVGKKIEDKDLQLDISKSFYNGSDLSEEDILKETREFSSLNIVGKEAVDFAVKNSLISKSNIIKIKNIPHAIVIAL